METHNVSTYLCSVMANSVLFAFHWSKKKKNYLAKAKASGKVDFSPTLNHGKNEDKRKYHE